jgi:hypothetical protein
LNILWWLVAVVRLKVVAVLVDTLLAHKLLRH